MVGAAGAFLASFRDAGSPAPSSAAATGADPASETRFRADAQRFYADVKTSLVPLLAHVGTLPATLHQAESQPVSPDLAAVAHSWAEDVATARDLVGRLIPPARPVGVHVRDLYEFGAMVYGESARSLARLPALADGAARTETARSGRRLYLVGDRLFDQAKRLLDLHGDLGVDPMVTLPAEVPDFDKEGLGPGGASARIPEGSGFTEANPATIPATRWRDDHLGRLAGAARALSRTADPHRAIAVDRDQLRRWSGELQAASRDSAGPVPGARAARQGSFLLRLSLLVESESLAVLSTVTSPDDAAFEQAQRLRLIGDRLWGLGRDLFAADGVRLPASLDLAETGIDPGILRRGGMFNGHPPPLKPGEPADTGVPGGLRVPVPADVFPGA